MPHLVPVCALSTGVSLRVVCSQCGALVTLSAAGDVYADIAGDAFRAYWCRRCALGERNEDGERVLTDSELIEGV